jgi:hypothetical protein
MRLSSLFSSSSKEMALTLQMGKNYCLKNLKFKNAGACLAKLLDIIHG